MAMNDPYNYSDNQGSFKYGRNDPTQNNQQQRRSTSPAAMPAPMSATSPAYQRNMQPMAPADSTTTAPRTQRNIQTQTPAPIAGMTTPAASPTSCMPTTLDCPYYTAGILRRFIGELVRVEFLIGSTAPMIDRTGTLLEVGASYIIIRPSDMPNNVEICDLYSIKFVNVIRLS